MKSPPSATYKEERDSMKKTFSDYWEEWGNTVKGWSSFDVAQHAWNDAAASEDGTPTAKCTRCSKELQPDNEMYCGTCWRA